MQIRKARRILKIYVLKYVLQHKFKIFIYIYLKYMFSYLKRKIFAAVRDEIVF